MVRSWERAAIVLAFTTLVAILAFIEPHPPGEDWGEYAAYASAVARDGTLTPSWAGCRHHPHVAAALILSPLASFLGGELAWRVVSVASAALFAWAVSGVSPSPSRAAAALFNPFTLTLVQNFLATELAIVVGIASGATLLAAAIHPAVAVAEASMTRRPREVAATLAVGLLGFSSWIAVDPRGPAFVLGAAAAAAAMRLLLGPSEDPRDLFLRLAAFYLAASVMIPDLIVDVAIFILIYTALKWPGKVAAALFVAFVVLYPLRFSYQHGVVTSPGIVAEVCSLERPAILVSPDHSVRPHVLMCGVDFTDRVTDLDRMMREHKSVAFQTDDSIEVLRGYGECELSPAPVYVSVAAAAVATAWEVLRRWVTGGRGD